MSPERLAAIPFEHIEAELAAFPLVSETSFRHNASTLNPLISRDDRLWRAAEKEVIGAIPSLPLDEAVAVRDKLWFGRADKSKNYETVSLARYLRSLAESYLDSNGRPFETNGRDSSDGQSVGPEGRLRWSWMCQAFPPDLLRVARGVVDPDENPLALSPAIETLLRDKGFAETHLHLGAAIDFPLAWAALMEGLLKDESRYSDFESPGASFNDGRQLSIWILYAAIARLVLADFLFERPESQTVLPERLEFTISRLARLDAVEQHTLATILSELKFGRLPKEPHGFGEGPEIYLARRFAQARTVYRRLQRAVNHIGSNDTHSRPLRLDSREGVFARDPIAPAVRWKSQDGVSPESKFNRAVLSRIEVEESKGKKDTDFSQLFWQITRVRSLLYRHVVQRPMTPGLQWFVRFFSRIKPLRKNLSTRVQASTAARITGMGSGLRSLEVRLGTDESTSACLNLVSGLEDVNPHLDEVPKFRFFQPKEEDTNDKPQQVTRQSIEVGGVFHFSRKRGGGWEVGRPNAFGLDHSFPGLPLELGKKQPKEANNPSGFRFGKFYVAQRRHAQALVSVLQKYPHSLRTIRGIDLCTDESGVPLWVMAPLVQWTREASKLASTQLKSRFNISIPPLRTTVHAGEDFVHLLAGLRRIDDTITYLNLEEGDRLGHALALGIDAFSWCKNVGRVVQTREERLIDLIWEWNCYSKENVNVSPTRLAYVRRSISRLIRAIMDDDCSYTPEELIAFWDALHQKEKLRDAGFPEAAKKRFRDLKSPERVSPEERILNAYLCDKDVWRRGRVLETIDMRELKHEPYALAELQKSLQQRIGKMCLTIEVNPSSNLLIGDLIDFNNHPLWKLKPLTQDGERSPLSICVGTDNPITFATSLPHEYQLLFDAIILGEQTHEVALKWMNEVRESGLRARFTISLDDATISQPLRRPIFFDPPPSLRAPV